MIRSNFLFRSPWGIAALLSLLASLSATRADAQATAARGTFATSAPAGRADYRSQHFYVHTDISAAEAKDLLERLEYMLGLISVYWQKPAVGIIEMYVVKDVKNWPAGSLPDNEGRQMIEAGGGLTISHVLGNTGKSTVYAKADLGTPQHEAVHAYCHQNFGTSGPTWYSEGMAEMGNYWRKNDAAVKIHEGIVAYIRKSEPKTLNDIVNGNEVTGDSWQNYAWRWALCHLLANNTNYAVNFRPLGLGMLNRKPVSFEQTYGHMANEISFEYVFFLRHLTNGYRADLCSWDWKRKFLAMPPGGSRVVRIMANKGWQPSGVLVKPEVAYEINATGSWKLDPKVTKPVTADGDEQGEGKLVGVIFKDFQLSEEFDVGAKTTLKAPSDGQMFLRMKSDWGSIGDNTGTIDVKISVAK